MKTILYSKESGSWKIVSKCQVLPQDALPGEEILSEQENVTLSRTRLIRSKLAERRKVREDEEIAYHKQEITDPKELHRVRARIMHRGYRAAKQLRDSL